jgi:hypothetical protein
MHLWIRRPLALALLACCPLAAEIRTLTILHTNDLHARMLPLENHHGGFAYLASVIRRERLQRLHFVTRATLRRALRLHAFPRITDLRSCNMRATT